MLTAVMLHNIDSGHTMFGAYSRVLDMYTFAVSTNAMVTLVQPVCVECTLQCLIVNCTIS